MNEEMLDDTVEEMTMDEIFNGKGDYFPGLVPLCYAYLDHMNCDKKGACAWPTLQSSSPLHLHFAAQGCTSSYVCD